MCYNAAATLATAGHPFVFRQDSESEPAHLASCDKSLWGTSGHQSWHGAGRPANSSIVNPMNYIPHDLWHDAAARISNSNPGHARWIETRLVVETRAEFQPSVVHSATDCWQKTDSILSPHGYFYWLFFAVHWTLLVWSLSSNTTHLRPQNHTFLRWKRRILWSTNDVCFVLRQISSEFCLPKFPNKSLVPLTDPRDPVPHAYRVVHTCRWSMW